MFDFFKKKAVLEELNCGDDQIVAIAEGHQVPIESVPDDVFAQKMMGDSIAFSMDGKEATVCSPANGELTVLFPTGHAFGITTADGVELLVHIGINTVNSKGEGFTILDKKQGDHVKAGDPIVKVNLNALHKTYDMSTMLIVTNANDKEIEFVREGDVHRGTVVGTIK